MSRIDEIKRASQVAEGVQVKISKEAALQSVAAMRAVEEIAAMPVGNNTLAEAQRMREIARKVTK